MAVIFSWFIEERDPVRRKPKLSQKPLSPHWADQTATRIVATRGHRQSYTLASGITPSGRVHIGNFREVITVDLVARALRDLGKEVRFLYSWDDFDTFRKVPSNLPQQNMLQSQLRRPICRIPDPYGQAKSYAQYNIRTFEGELAQLGIKPEYIYQNERYSQGVYAEGIRTALEKKDDIRRILNQYRQTPLADDWLPTAAYCEECDRDEMVSQSYGGEYIYHYECRSCGHKGEMDFRHTKHLKLNWRTDWPMRWHHEQVDFEPGGKDHSSEGGSFDTAKQIVQEVYDFTPPQYLQYDFVSIKGVQGKMSSSAGNLLTLSEAFEVYDPQMVRWIFASQRPNHDFSLAFDQDVIKVYDEFDRAERLALGPPPEKLGKWPMIRRTYELSVIDALPDQAPYRAPFRELCNRIQIFDGDAHKTLQRYYQNEVKTPLEEELFIRRAECAYRWLTRHAPDEFRYQLHKDPLPLSLSGAEDKGLKALVALIEAVDLETIDAKELNQRIYDDVLRAKDLEAKDFFPVVYQKLIGRDRGPRLPAFLKEIGFERLRQLLG